jgi:hypothetical protein
MPSLPGYEEPEVEESNAEVIRDIARSAYAAAVPKEIGLFTWVALVVILLVVATNPTIPLVVAGVLACLYVAVDLTRVGRSHR